MTDDNLRIVEIPCGYIISKDDRSMILTIKDLQDLITKATTEHPEYFRKKRK